MKRVGIIGLGDMGLAIARNIIKSGFELTGFDLREERLKLLEETSGRAISRHFLKCVWACSKSPASLRLDPTLRWDPGWSGKSWSRRSPCSCAFWESPFEW